MTSVVCLALLLLTYLQVDWDKREALKQHVEEMQNLATALTRQAESAIRDAHTVLIGIERHLTLSGYGMQNLSDVLQITRAQLGVLQDVEGFTVIGSDGRALLTTIDGVAEQYHALDRAFFLYHQSSRNPGLYIGKPIQSRLSGAWVIPLSLRLNDANGNFRGVALATLLIGRFVDFYQGIDLGDQGIINLSRRDGSILARSQMTSESLNVNIGKSPVMRMINDDGVTRGSMIITALVDGVQRIYGFDSSSIYPIVVAAAVPEQQALQAWRQRAYLAWGLTAVLVLLCIGMAWSIWRALLRQGEMEASMLGMHQNLAEANRALEIIAGEDALTGLANRRGLDEALQAAYHTAAMQRQALSFVLIDVDYFKRFNDQYGHQQGDEALRQVATVLRQLTRRSLDTSARYGGEELALVLPGASRATAAIIAEKVRAAVENLNIVNAGSPYGKLTVSIGVASCDPGREIAEVSSLVRAADVALYAAKGAGRNRVMLSDTQDS